MKTLYARLYQKVFYLVSFFLPWRTPILLEGKDKVKLIPEVLIRKNIEKVLIITDQGIMKHNLMNGMLEALDASQISYVIYDKTVPNPTLDNVEEALNLYHKAMVDGVIAFGGGSPMDCAKAMCARVARPNKTLHQLRGVLKVRKRVPFLVAVATTAGTGSETTVAAVVSNPDTHEKFAINDPVLIPRVAVLDCALTETSPKG